MSETTDQGKKKTLTLGKKLELKKVVESDAVRQSFSHGRSKTVAVEVKRRRVVGAGEKTDKTTESEPETQPQDVQDVNEKIREKAKSAPSTPSNAGRLTEDERETRLKAVQEAIKAEAIEVEARQRRLQEEQMVRLREELEAKERAERGEPPLEREEKKEELEVPTGQKFPEVSPNSTQEKQGLEVPQLESDARPQPRSVIYRAADFDEEDESGRRRASSGAGKDVKQQLRAPAAPVRKEYEQPRKLNRALITKALSGEIEDRSRSMASIRRARQKNKQSQQQTETIKIIRDVIIPDVISVGELANRMAVRGADVIKSLMKLGMMLTINQTIDADTAELICEEFGHKFKRVSESDIEIGLRGEEDVAENLVSRAPVVTVMGHVDHGKTSLLDALRLTDVVSGEAGGITQHIGAYQVNLASGHKITFIDTPGHAAFTEMRARGATVTDIVILVVAADDGIMEQTVEAINHAKAAQVPMIVAINKIDKPAANAERVRSELLQHGIVLEEFGGDVLSVEVSAKQKLNLDKLEETILLQSEVLDLKANPNRSADGVVIEAQVDRGRGTVSTVLIQRGTLKIGDIFVAGSEWGRVRALINDRGQKVLEATPSTPVEILGFNGVPSAGDEFFVVENENRAREVAEFRQRRDRDAKSTASARTSVEQMMTKIAAGEVRELGLVIKSDVQGSLEAITTSLAKLGTDEVAVRLLHGGVGGINESDVTLARASGGIIIGFNVRANPQARDMARRDGIDLRYYSIIYDVIDDMKAIMGGLLAPTLRENYLGTAEIREVFTVTKIGKIAGCYVTEGTVKRGAKVRLLRDNVVIHEGVLKSLRRFKDEVKEVNHSYECGMAFENYNDIQKGDMIECFEMESIARQL